MGSRRGSKTPKNVTFAFAINGSRKPNKRNNGDQPKVVFCTTENDLEFIEQAIEQKARETVQVCDVDLQQIVHVARQGVAGHHLLPLGHPLGELVDRLGLVPGKLHPDEGLEPGTRWEDIPDTWTCPDCGVTKDDFEMVEFD